MKVLVLDTRALEVLADSHADKRAAMLMRDLVSYAKRTRRPVRIPTPVLAEAYRGTAADAAVDRVMKDNVQPITFGKGMARHAARLKHRDKLNSCHMVDAAVVATAVRLGGAVIATGDPGDLESLAREYSNIEIFAL